MKINQLILLSLILAGIYSCSTEFVPIIEEASDETVILAELEVGEDPTLLISSTFGPDGDIIRPISNDGEIRISNLTTNQLDKGLRFEPKAEHWFDTNFAFKAGHELTLRSEFNSVGLGETFSETVVPFEGSIITKAATLTNQQNDGYFTITLELEEMPETNYYHLKPFVLNENNVLSYLDIESVTHNGEASFDLSHTDGILIDYSLLQEDKRLIVETKSKDLSNPSSSIIHLELRSVPRDYYEFHKSITTQKITQQGPFDAPVPTYTNIGGGQGIFVTYHKTIEQVSIQ